MTLAAGNLQHRITLQQQQMTVDPVTNEPITTWIDAGSVWANVHYLSSRERILSAASQLDTTGWVQVRQPSDVNETWRFIFKSKPHNIVGVRPDSDSTNEYLTLDFSEGVNNGIP